MKRLTAWRRDDELTSAHDQLDSNYDFILDVASTASDDVAAAQQSCTTVDELDRAFAKVIDELKRCSTLVSGECKQLGIDNEEQLKIGRDRISEIERQLDDLNDDLDKLESIDDLQSQVADLEDEITRANEKLANVNARTADPAGTNIYLCHVHDEITDTLDYGVDNLEYCVTELKKLAPGDVEQFKATVAEAVEQLETMNDEVVAFIDEARDMNNRMCSAIDDRNGTINEILDDIDDRSDELSDANADLDQARSTLAELERLLSDLLTQIDEIELRG